MTSRVGLIYEKVPIGANLLKNAENDYSFQSMYVKSHLSNFYKRYFFDRTLWNMFFRASYSWVPNKRGGTNKRGGWKMFKISINGGVLISGGVGNLIIVRNKKRCISHFFFHDREAKKRKNNSQVNYRDYLFIVTQIIASPIPFTPI